MYGFQRLVLRHAHYQSSDRLSQVITHDRTHTSFHLAAVTCTLHFSPSTKTPILVIMIKSFDLPPLSTLRILMTRLVGYPVNQRSITAQPLDLYPFAQI